MLEDTSSVYHRQPDEAFHSRTAVDASSIEFVTTQPGEDPDFVALEQSKPKGRHRFTREECSRGFWAAIDSIIARHPDAVMRDGRHISCNFLKSKGARV